MASIVDNPIEEIWERFVSEIVETGYIQSTQISFGNSDVGAKLPWIAFKPMTNYSWTQARDLENNENGIIVNIQVECYSKKESEAMRMEDACKEVMFGMGFYTTGFAQRFKNDSVHRYSTRFAMYSMGNLLEPDGE